MEIPTASSYAGNTKSRRRRVREEKKATNGDFYNSSEDEKEHRSKDDKMYGSACSLGRFFLNPCLCICTAGRFCWRHRCLLRDKPLSLPCSSVKTGKRSRRDSILIILSLLVCIYLLPNLFSVRGFRFHQLRPTSDAEVERLDLAIPILDFKEAKIDIGGWMFPQRRIPPQAPIEHGSSEKKQDFGDLKYVSTGGAERNIGSDDALLYEKYIFNDILKLGKKQPHEKHGQEHADEIEDEKHSCRRPNWLLLYKPACNAIHELDTSRDFHEEMATVGDDQIFDSFYIAHGYYRDVWVVNNFVLKEHLVMKRSRYKFEFNIGDFHSTLRDALIMERLTASPRIIDAFAHCGTTVLVEPIPFEVEEYVVPGEGFIKQDELHDEIDVRPMNNFTIEEKLHTALEMAESLADLHGFKDGVIVHDDVQLCQWLRLPDGKLKLGDFNRAEVMEYNSEEQKYCKYNNGKGYGNYRSPEEFAGTDLDEKIDIFSFGNNIYGLLTGLWVFYENEDDEVVQKKLTDGEKAYIDPRYRKRSSIEGKLVEIMEKCWEIDPAKRIDIFEVVKFLREVVKESNRRGNGQADEADRTSQYVSGFLDHKTP